MTKVSRKGFRDKNGKQVVLKDPTKADKVPSATSGNLASFDAEGNLQDTGIDAGLVGKVKFLYRLEIQKLGAAYVWGTSVTQALLEEIYNTLANGPSDAIPVLVRIPNMHYAGFAARYTSLKEFVLYVGDIAFQVNYNPISNQWTTPIYITSAVVLNALNSTEQLSSGNDYRLITSGAVKAALAHLPVINDYLLNSGQYQSLGVDIDKAYDAVVKFPAPEQCDILVRAVVTGDERPDSSQLSATVELVWGSNLYSFERNSLSQLRSLIRTAVLSTGVTASAYDDATFGAKYFQLFYKVVIDSTSAQSGGYLEFELYNA